MRSRRSIFALTLVSALLFSSLALAATVLKMDLADLVRESDKIVLGHVESTTAFMHEGRVYTDISVNVERTFKGDEASKLVIRHLGGRTAELATHVPGMPHFATGERAVLFLEQPGKSPYFVVAGLSQGKWPVADTESGLVIGAPTVSNLNIVRRPGDTGAAALPAPAAQPLATFEARVRELLEPSKSQ